MTPSSPDWTEWDGAWLRRRLFPCVRQIEVLEAADSGGAQGRERSREVGPIRQDHQTNPWTRRER